MNIDRHNYEEWFLLYADDELSAADRREVEAFMERNPDLAGELEILRQLKLDPSEGPAFPGKASLYRQEEEEVSEEDAMLLSYLDGELHGGALSDAERRIAADPRLAARLEQFQAAVMPAESIIFPDKASLYRKAERQAPVISIKWLRVAVAAAVLIAGAALWMNLGEQSAPSGQQAIASRQGAGNEQPTTNNQQPTTNNEQPTTNSEQPALADAQPRSTIRNARPSSVTKAPQERNTDGSSEDVAANDNGQPTPDTRQPMTSNNLPVPSTDVAVNTTPTDRSATEIVDRPVANTVAKSDYATQALLNPGADENPVMETTDKARKSPFRGLVRKANRLFNKATNPDPDKATVKVASFEIALGR